MAEGFGELVHKIGWKLVERRGRQHEVHIGIFTGHSERSGDVVAVSDKNDSRTLHVGQFLANREHIGHGLARVSIFAESIDNRNGGVFGQLFHFAVGMRPDGEGVNILTDHTGKVGNRLADSQADLFASEKERAPTQ